MTQPKHRVLIVDDDRRLRALLEQYLASADYTVFTAADADEAVAVLDKQAVDVMVLDVMMPGKTGVELTRELKQMKQFPIMLLTAMGEVEDRITGLESGADDYLTKPFEPRELCLRIENLVGRYKPATKTQKLVFGKYEYDVELQELHEQGSDSDIPLSSSEQQLFGVFAEHANEPVSREQLAQALNGISERSVDVQITRLRKKIEDDPRNPQHLRTARGKGYVLKADVSS